MGKSKSFVFDGGAATYLGTAVLGWLVTICTLGLAVPFAIVLRHRWKAKHTCINGHRLVFLGSGTSLLLNWLKWWFLSITLGVYLFWAMPPTEVGRREHGLRSHLASLARSPARRTAPVGT